MGLYSTVVTNLSVNDNRNFYQTQHKDFCIVALMDTYSKRLTWAMAQTTPPTSQSELARAIGVSPQTIQYLCDPLRNAHGSKHSSAIAEFLGVNSLWLAEGKGPRRPALSENNVEPAPALRSFKDVPVVGTVEAGPDGYLEEIGYPTGHGDGVVEYPAKDKNAYALRVRGESMRPRIKSGEYIVVEPHTVAHAGDDVVVICRDGRKMVKELLYTRDGEVTLGSINDGFKPISIREEDIDAIHYVAAIIPRGAFYKS